MTLRSTFLGWPVLRQLAGDDGTGRGEAVQSPRSAAVQPRTRTADRVVKSIWPF